MHRVVICWGDTAHLQKEVQDMIWEVDENLDGLVDWDEFKLMFKVGIISAP